MFLHKPCLVLGVKMGFKNLETVYITLCLQTRKNKKEVRKKYFLSETQKKEIRRLSLSQNHLRYFPSKYVRLLGSLGSDISLFNKVRRQPFNIYALVYLYPLYLTCTVFKELYYSIWSLFDTIQFSVCASNFHKYKIADYVVISNLSRILLDIINVHLSLFTSGYTSLVYN